MEIVSCNICICTHGGKNDRYNALRIFSDANNNDNWNMFGNNKNFM